MAKRIAKPQAPSLSDAMAKVEALKAELAKAQEMTRKFSTWSKPDNSVKYLIYKPSKEANMSRGIMITRQGLKELLDDLESITHAMDELGIS